MELRVHGEKKLKKLSSPHFKVIYWGEPMTKKG